jgi:CO/xanthine dehydrogenase FAD-binding subunit
VIFQALQTYGDKAKLIAGGTTVYELAKRGMIPNIEALIDIQFVNLDHVTEGEDGLHIGATCTLTDLLSNNSFGRPGYAALGDALREVRPVQVRNVATIGGEVCASLSFFDLPPALVAVNASAQAVSSAGERNIPLEKFWIDYFLTTLKRGELVRELIVPKPPPKTGSAFLKLGRTADDFALVNVGAQVTLDDGEVCASTRIALGGVAKTIIRATKVEKLLEGRRLDAETIVAATQPLEELKPVASIHGGPEYKRELAKILVRDAVTKAKERALSPGIA